MTWSYSKLTTFKNCPYEFYLRYIKGTKKEENFYGVFGSFVHEILEKYEKGELPIYEISQYYMNNFDEYVPDDGDVDEETRDKYYTQGLDYLDNIDLLFEDYDILGVEKKIQFEVESYPFEGYIDLLLRHKDDGQIIMVDHKSRNLKFKKNGDLSKSSLDAFDSFKKQQYLYSRAVIDEYGKAPTKLCWNMFRDKKWISVDFDPAEYEKTLQWASWSVGMIRLEEDWRPNPQFFYCRHLCGMRGKACEYK